MPSDIYYHAGCLLFLYVPNCDWLKDEKHHTFVYN